MITNNYLSQLRDYLVSNISSMLGKRTNKLWFRYLDMAELIMNSIREDGTGNWLLLLKYFPATGHNNYKKCTYLYLQKMDSLEHDFPDVYQLFIKGQHCIRRSDRFWADIFSDQIIEQCLMKNENVEVKGQEAEELINFNEISEQHKEICSSRMKTESDDTIKVVSSFLYHNLLSPLENVRNIITGVSANIFVNYDSAEDIGMKNS